MSNRNDQSVSRREFMGAAAGVAAIAATNPLSIARTAFSGANDRIKIGLVGCGGRGTGAATNALNADPGVVLWAMGDVFSDRVQSSYSTLEAHCKEQDENDGGTAWADRLQVATERRFSGFDAYQKVIDSGVDVVLLCSTPAFRPIHIQAAVNAGKHIFTEKPMATDATGVRSVMESARIAKAKGLSILSGFCWRYNPAEQATMERIHAGAIGDVLHVYTNYNTDGFPAPKSRKPEWSEVENQLRSWHYYTYLSGDHIAEQAIHAIDWQCWVAKNQPPASCTAVGGRQVRTESQYGNVYDHFAAVYEYDSGMRATHMSRHWPNCSRDNSLYLSGSKGRLTMHPWTPSHVIEGENPWKYEGPTCDMYDNEHKVFFKALRDGRQHWDGDWMCTSTLMAIMARMAAYTGQTVTWKQAMESKEQLVPAGISWTDAPALEIAKPGVTKLI
jgi:predicted dehydrogenase